MHLQSSEVSQAAHPGYHDRVREGGEDESITVMLNPIQGIKHVTTPSTSYSTSWSRGKPVWACPGRQSMQPLGLLYTHPRQLLDDGDVQVLGIGSGVLHWVVQSVKLLQVPAGHVCPSPGPLRDGSVAGCMDTHTQPGNVLGGAQISGFIEQVGVHLPL